MGWASSALLPPSGPTQREVSAEKLRHSLLFTCFTSLPSMSESIVTVCLHLFQLLLQLGPGSRPFLVTYMPVTLRQPNEPW